jgi:hypothetical protein
LAWDGNQYGKGCQGTFIHGKQTVSEQTPDILAAFTAGVEAQHIALAARRKDESLRATIERRQDRIRERRERDAQLMKSLTAESCLPDHVQMIRKYIDRPEHESGTPLSQASPDWLAHVRESCDATDRCWQSFCRRYDFIHPRFELLS